MKKTLRDPKKPFDRKCACGNNKITESGPNIYHCNNCGRSILYLH